MRRGSLPRSQHPTRTGRVGGAGRGPPLRLHRSHFLEVGIVARSSSLNDPTSSPAVKEIRERYEYANGEWADIRKEGALDMRFVTGRPFTAEEEAEREDRPTIAPEEMSQYRNQVTNNLRANPRGM